LVLESIEFFFGQLDLGEVNGELDSSTWVILGIWVILDMS